MKKYLCLVGSILAVIVIAGIIIWVLCGEEQPTLTSSEKQRNIVVDFQTPENLENFYIQHDWDYSVENITDIFHCSVRVTSPENLDDLVKTTQEMLDQGGQYWVYTFDPLSSYQENSEITYTYYMLAKDENQLASDIPPIRQDNVGENFCFYTRWGVAYITEPVIFSMTIILPQGYEVDNVQCSDLYMVTSEDNRAKVVVENATLDRDFELFTLRIDYRKV